LAVAVVGIGYVEVEARLDQVAPEQNLGGGIQAVLDVVKVLSCHHQHEVLAFEVRGVGVGGDRARQMKARSIEGGASARVHGTSDVPARRARAGDDHVIVKVNILGEEVSKDDLGHR
jgi:hypothetical protein